ncbi:MAG: D-2-hydroxyacid dehydrogenase [Anaerolineae bacterium]
MPEFVLPVLEKRACDLVEACEIVVIDDDGEIQGDAAGAEVVMVPWAVPQETYEEILGVPTLRWVHTVSAGIDHALAALPHASDVLITNASGIFDVPIAEMVLAYMLVAVKRIPELLDQQRAHTWHLLRLRELAGLTVGIVGLGHIGREVALRCKAMGMEVLGVRKHPDRGAEFADKAYGPDELDVMIERSHFVVLALPVTPETRGLIGAAELRRMRPDAWLINVARGAILDQDALISALASGRIAGAALDVFEEEPLPEDSPLWDLDNVIITPHNAWSTPYLKQREAELFLDNLERYQAGEALRNVIDPSRGY